jgi:hypothetical protein
VTKATINTRPGCMTQMSIIRPMKLVIMKRAPESAANHIILV